MLTGDLVRVRIKAREIAPSFIKPDDEELLGRAEQLLELYRVGLAERWTRRDIAEAVAEIEGVDTDIKLTRGLAKVLSDRAEFAVVTPLEPVDLRALVFETAARTGPLARQAGPLQRRTRLDVMAEIAAQLGCTPEAIGAALYGDLKEEQILVNVDLLTPEALLHRYNVSLVQAMLLKATGLTLTLSAPEPKRVRQLYRALKFHGLMYRVTSDGEDWVLSIDGPMSLLQQSTRYGLQLGLFLPTALLLPGPWKIEAELRWGQRGLRKAFTLTDADGLKSPARDVGAWRSRVEEYFEERFKELDSGWEIAPGEALDLGGQELLVPDFTFKKSGKTAHLDIIGWWRKTYLKRRLATLPPNVVLAVSKRLAGEAAGELPERVVVFAEVIPAGKVLERLEKVAR